MQLFAYKLASISRTNIEREAGKTGPELRKLVGHASLFDHANHFIIDHAEFKAEEADEAEDLDEVESLDDDSDEDDIFNTFDEEDDGPSILHVEDVQYAISRRNIR